MELKPQDLLVLLKVVANPPQRWTYAGLGKTLTISASEIHASIKRATMSGLVMARGPGDWSVLHEQLLEFILYGVRYVWPTSAGAVKRGIPTSFGAEPLSKELTATPGEAPVWAYPTGSTRGPTMIPLYRTVPQAALEDPALHRVLALLDAIRTGRARERALAARLMEKEFARFTGNQHA